VANALVRLPSGASAIPAVAPAGTPIFEDG